VAAGWWRLAGEPGDGGADRLKAWQAALIVLIGVALVAVGAACIYLPAGLIVAGLGLAAYGAVIVDVRS
jgi:hypothetical protein